MELLNNAQEFAEKYANRRIAVGAAFVVSGNIIGWCGQKILIERDDVRGILGPHICKRCNIIVPGKLWGSLISIQHIRLLDEEVIKRVKPYPHICKSCYSPGRKLIQTFMCSNTKCKTRVAFKKTYSNRSIKDNIIIRVNNFDVSLVDSEICSIQTEDYIEAIKKIRIRLNIGLKEAKYAVDQWRKRASASVW